MEAAKIIVREFNLLSEIDQSSPWYRQYVVTLVNHKAVPTTVIFFDQRITRGEMAEIVARLLRNDTTKPSHSYEDLTSTSSGNGTVASERDPQAPGADQPANTHPVLAPSWQHVCCRSTLAPMASAAPKAATDGRIRRSGYAGLDFIKAAFCPLDFNAMRFADHPEYRQLAKDETLAELEVSDPLHYPRQFPYIDPHGNRKTGTQIVTAHFGLAPNDFDMFLGLFTYQSLSPGMRRL